MVNSVGAKGFKGLPDFETKLERLTLLCGPNGAGKTARSHALQLAILGFVPGIARTNRDIMSAFGTGDKLVVEVRRDGVRCSRGYFQDKDGKVTEKFQLDLKRVTRDQYAVALGGIKLFDLGAFQKLSDQGKIDQVFALFPPGEGYNELSEAIAAKKEERNTLQKSMEGINGTIERLSSQRSEIKLPAGTFAEITAAIKEAETQLQMTQQLAEQNRVKYAAAQAKERAERIAAEKAEADRIERERQAERDKLKALEQQCIEQAKLVAQAKANAENVYARHQAELQAEREKALAEAIYATKPLPIVLDKDQLHIGFTGEEVSQKINSILATIERTGCGACAAALLCRRELKKLREVA